jgi:hypothetical protein
MLGFEVHWDRVNDRIRSDGIILHCLALIRFTKLLPTIFNGFYQPAILVLCNSWLPYYQPFLLAGFVLLTDFFNPNLCPELTRAFTRILATQGNSSPRLSLPEAGAELDLPPKHAGASINTKTGTHMHLVEALKSHTVCNSVIRHWSQNVCPPPVRKQ